jgi:nitrite reductase/ring-hydroxylating ferredoxin subunit
MGGIMDFFKALAGICETEPLAPDSWTKEGSDIKINLDKTSALHSAWSAAYLKGPSLDKPVLVVKDDEGRFHSFSNKCSHAGRKLDPIPGKRELRCCSVSHSTFDYSGAVLSGPAKNALETYPCSEQDSILTIKTK